MSFAEVARKPDWLKIRPPSGDSYANIKQLLKGLKLHTVCEEARCPNVAECWGGGTATIMILGDTCTRGCKFCNVKTGNPRGIVDDLEPVHVAEAIAKLGLTYVVLTSVDRDDLSDGGADHFGKSVENIRKLSSDTLVEVLIPDFGGDEMSLRRLIASNPDVIAQNIETVERLTQKVRDGRCGYETTRKVLERVREIAPQIYRKSSIMVGLGETREEVLQCMRDLLDSGVQILTLGQYLRPSSWHLPVESYVHPDEFARYREAGIEMGFMYVASGPLVRSSYRAGELFLEGKIRNQRLLSTVHA